MRYNKPSEDLGNIPFSDNRLTKRLCKTLELKEQHISSSVLSACGSRHDAKAFYSFLGNKKVSYEKISERAFQATSERIADSGITRVLLVEDTSDINMNGHKKTEGLGYCSELVRGVKQHSCLALTPDGQPLGLIGQHYDSRAENRSSLSAKEKYARPIEDKESYRWLTTAEKAIEIVPSGVETVVICDREGDFYELYAKMSNLNSLFVVRLAQDRMTTDDEKSIPKLRNAKPCAEIDVFIPRNSQKNIPERTAKMEIACCTVTVKRPKRPKGSKCTLPESLTLNLVRISEIGDVSEPIEWLLATNLPVDSEEDILEVFTYYIHRWKIERFFYVLKSGCQAEKIQQRSYKGIQSVLLIYSVVAAYILGITYAARISADTPCDFFLEEDEWKILYCLVHGKKEAPDTPYSLKTAIECLGELGSYRHSPSDGEYGVKAIWQGLFRLYEALDVVDRLMGQV